MKTYKLTLTEDELKELAIYTSTVNDLKVGKNEEIANKGFSYFMNNLDVFKLSSIFEEMKKIQFPKLSKNKFLESYTTNMKKRKFISQSLKNAYAFGKYPSGGVTNWFNKITDFEDNVKLNIVKK